MAGSVWSVGSGQYALVALVWSLWFDHFRLVTLAWSLWSGQLGLVDWVKYFVGRISFGQIGMIHLVWSAWAIWFGLVGLVDLVDDEEESIWEKKASSLISRIIGPPL